VTVSLLDIQY